MTDSEPPLIAVVAASHRDFINWCYDNDRNPRDKYLKCITKDLRDRIRGYIFDEVIALQGSDYATAQDARARLRGSYE